MDETNVAKVVKGLGYISMVASIFIFGSKDSIGAMSAGVVGSALILAFAHLEQFSKFKGLGFEAELKELASSTIKEIKANADNTVNQLKAVAAATISTNLSILAREGRYNSQVTIGYEHELFDQLSSLHADLNIENDLVDKFKNEYVYINAWDQIKLISHEISKQNQIDDINIFKLLGATSSYDFPPDLGKFRLHVQDLGITLNATDEQNLKNLERFIKKAPGSR